MLFSDIMSLVTVTQCYIQNTQTEITHTYTLSLHISLQFIHEFKTESTIKIALHLQKVLGKKVTPF